MLQQAEKAEKNLLRSPTNKDLGLSQIARMNSASSGLPVVVLESAEVLSSHASGEMTTSRVRAMSTNSKRFFRRMSAIMEEENLQQEQQQQEA